MLELIKKSNHLKLIRSLHHPLPVAESAIKYVGVSFSVLVAMYPLYDVTKIEETDNTFSMEIRIDSNSTLTCVIDNNNICTEAYLFRD